ncbi:DUF802 domain-containing protein [Rhodoferax sp. AJA081-3]|uniref:DUF802 domain-containing protein n=1 Tax=Rhodoferax sp. AJA081-3 TaxID=2752316 RepID=UPI001ADFACF6|nr:DUF802 domain-containing protein [Rhodoferax sp. AJA081-3]QTN27145.1 DUF802 domain-containing protein [Rhodoferax sp. AJA081-3]
MNKQLFAGAFALGAMAAVWVAAGFFASANMLALLMTVVIAAVYAFGALELQRFRQATAGLASALAAIPADLQHLGDWLTRVPAPLQNTVRLRVEGERVGLPGPALTPYLVGLLVMLGMLGTFLGMVVTLNGAVFALESTTDLQAIRSAFAAPIKGLGLSFGTSVAGVATSAMLGLMSAICRRERLVAAQTLDTAIATTLRGFSLTHQRQETYKALQQQSLALPAVVNQMQTMMAQMETMSRQLNERLLSNQQAFHSDVKGVYTELASSVGQSLRDSLSESAHAVGASIKPVFEATMAGIAQEAHAMHTRLVDTTQTQLDGVSARFTTAAATVTDGWSVALAKQEHTHAALVAGLGQSLDAFGQSFAQRSASHLDAMQTAYAALQVDHASGDRKRLEAWMASLEATSSALKQEWQQAGAHTLEQQQAICNTLSRTAQDMAAQAQTSASQSLDGIASLLAQSEELVRTRIDSEATWTQQHNERMDQAVNTLRAELVALRDAEALRGQAAVERLGELQTALTGHLSTLGTALEEPITRLIETASEAPRAAAEVIGKLRQEVSSSAARDNELLEERGRIMATLGSLLEAINHASVEQRAVIDSLVASSAVALTQAGSQFAEKVDAEAVKLADIAAHVTGSAVEVSALGESFGFAVKSFNEANEKLIANLQRIESAMDKSMARSDEQLAYYVGQAREIIDLSILSQKEVFEGLRQLPAKQAPVAEEVA